jgi:hypothetical protein
LEDVENRRKKKSVRVGPATGKGRLTKAEAQRKAAELIDKLGINSEAHLLSAQHPEQVEAFRQRLSGAGNTTRPGRSRNRERSLQWNHI